MSHSALIVCQLQVCCNNAAVRMSSVQSALHENFPLLLLALLDARRGRRLQSINSSSNIRLLDAPLRPVLTPVPALLYPLQKGENSFKSKSETDITKGRIRSK